jgi:hypothetical protein
MAYDLQQKRLAIKREMEAKIKEISSEEDALEEHMFALFGNEALERASGSRANGTIKKTTVYNVKDWDLFYQFILENRAFDLLHKRVTVSAVAERVESGVAVPGTEPFTKMEINITGR